MDFKTTNPILKLFPFFLIGLVVGLESYINRGLWLAIFILASAIFIISVLLNRYNRYIESIRIVFLIISLTSFGILYGSYYVPKLGKYPKTAAIYTAKIITSPKINSKSVYATVSIINYALIEEDTLKLPLIPFRKKVLLYLPRDSISERLFYGDKIIFYGMLDTLKESGNPCEFSYKKYLRHKGVLLRSYSQNFKIIGHNCANPVVYFSQRIRNKLLSIYKKYNIEGEQLAVLSALSLGYKQGITAELRQNFARTGAMHILAVSGLHVGIIYLIINFLLSFLDKKRKLFWVKPTFVILSLWLFAFIAGLSPSVQRAAFMFSFFSFSKILRRPYFIYNAIAASAWVLLLINPLDIYSIGFQLSYAAVLSIIIFQQGIYRLIIITNKFLDAIWSLLSVTLAAQIGTMPISIFYFHQFPNYFFITNLIVIPLASLILYLAVGLLFLSPVVVLGKVIAYVLKILLNILIKSTFFISQLPYAVSSGLFIDKYQMLLLYLLLITLTIYITKKNKVFALWFLTFTALFFLLRIIQPKEFYNKEIWILNIPKTTAISIFDNKTHILLADTSLLYHQRKIDRILKCYLEKRKIKNAVYADLDDAIFKNEEFPQLIKINDFIKIFDKTFLMVNSSKIKYFLPEQSIKVDYVIISHNPNIHLDDIKKYCDFDTLIISSDNRLYKRKMWISEAEKSNIAYYDISTIGAKRLYWK